MANQKNLSIEDMNQEDELENEIGNFIVLTDEEDNDVVFELMAIMEHEDKEYAVLFPVDDEDESVVVILQIVEDGVGEDGEVLEAYLPVEDEELLDALFQAFMAEYPDFFEEE